METNDMLSSLLNDPNALQTALSMASSLFGNNPEESTNTPAVPSQSAYDPSADLIQKAIPVLSRIAQKGQTAISPEKRDLLNAVKPFLGERVALQIDHGMRLVSLARMATAVIGQSTPSATQEGEHV